MTDYEMIVYTIGSLGFPIVAYFYLVMKFEKRLEKLEEALNEVCETMSQIQGFIKRESKESNRLDRNEW